MTRAGVHDPNDHCDQERRKKTREVRTPTGRDRVNIGSLVHRTHDGVARIRNASLEPQRLVQLEEPFRPIVAGGLTVGSPAAPDLKKSAWA